MKKNNDNITKVMLRRFIPSIILIIVLIIAKHYVLQYYMSSMDAILYEYEIEVIDILNVLNKAETLLYILILFLIIFMAIFIFHPTLKSLSKAFIEAKESNENIMKLFKIAHGAIFLIELETSNIILMNKEAEKLINTEYREGLNINKYIKIKSLNLRELIEDIKESDDAEDLGNVENSEVELILNDNEKMYAIVNVVKTSFNNKDAVLMGLFDISYQKQCEETFKNMAIKDKLTGLYNRYYFEKRVNDKIDEAKKYDEPISMLMLDLDKFKSINDTYGHPVGDEVLKLVANTLNNVVRKSDYVFRLGGEEFAVLIPKADIYAADNVAEKIRVELEKINHPVVGKITASIGVAERLKYDSLDDWYKRVDKALYCAKEGGRNCVVNYGENINYATAHIEWNKDWESGNKTIDKQHEELIELGNSLIYMSLSNFPIEKTLIQLDNLLEHIKSHFAYETSVIKEAGYSGFAEHKEIHDNLINKAYQLKQDFLNGKIKKTAFFSYLVDDIIIEHMLIEDKKFFEILKS